MSVGCVIADGGAGCKAHVLPTSTPGLGLEPIMGARVGAGLPYFRILWEDCSHYVNRHQREHQVSRYAKTTGDYDADVASRR